MKAMFELHEGDVILDPCKGRGSPGVACMKCDINFIGIEIDRDYYDIGLERIQDAWVNLQKRGV